MKQEIKLDKRNYRKHSEKNKDLINNLKANEQQTNGKETIKR